ncbi:F-box/kelch-repeat protein At3g06240-like [Apium graveolens]|uniref:F-box/kelch-repeat protein At3g06240-like n=1 Tax=Apium graveolens TaxID=4045 RepID=UPI003D7B034D
MYSVHFDKDNLCDKSASKLRFSCCGSWSKVWGSCDGLVLVEDAWRTMYLLNPTTLESKKLPALRCRFRSHVIRNLYGFGYDSSCDDYAVVFMCYQPGLKKEFCVYVYTLKKNVWEKIGYSPYDHKADSLSRGIFFKGSLHWLAKNYNRRCRRFISALNIAKQEFSKVSPPTAVYRAELLYSKLEVHEGCLCLTALVANVHMTVEL